MKNSELNETPYIITGLICMFLSFFIGIRFHSYFANVIECILCAIEFYCIASTRNILSLSPSEPISTQEANSLNYLNYKVKINLTVNILLLSLIVKTGLYFILAIESINISSEFIWIAWISSLVYLYTNSGELTDAFIDSNVLKESNKRSLDKSRSNAIIDSLMSIMFPLAIAVDWLPVLIGLLFLLYNRGKNFVGSFEKYDDVIFETSKSVDFVTLGAFRAFSNMVLFCYLVWKCSYFNIQLLALYLIPLGYLCIVAIRIGPPISFRHVGDWISFAKSKANIKTLLLYDIIVLIVFGIYIALINNNDDRFIFLSKLAATINEVALQTTQSSIKPELDQGYQSLKVMINKISSLIIFGFACFLVSNVYQYINSILKISWSNKLFEITKHVALAVSLSYFVYHFDSVIQAMGILCQKYCYLNKSGYKRLVVPLIPWVMLMIETLFLLLAIASAFKRKVVADDKANCKGLLFIRPMLILIVPIYFPPLYLLLRSYGNL